MKDVKQINSILRLRRDNDYNFEKVKYTFIPQNGEVVLVDTAKQGLVMKIGDGEKCYEELPIIRFINEASILVRGVYSDGNFYTEDGIITPSQDKLYIDVKTYTIYCYNNGQYETISGDSNIHIEEATPETAGIMKLYNTTGKNSDGTMTQQSITSELRKKMSFEISSNDSEMIIFKQEDL